jgi:menaquinone-dependent protoporphyrinogen IX oxidase
MDGIANVFDVRENPDLSKYDHVVIGGAIQGGKTSWSLMSASRCRDIRCRNMTT